MPNTSPITDENLAALFAREQQGTHLSTFELPCAASLASFWGFLKTNYPEQAHKSENDGIIAWNKNVPIADLGNGTKIESLFIEATTEILMRVGRLGDAHVFAFAAGRGVIPSAFKSRLNHYWEYKNTAAPPPRDLALSMNAYAQTVCGVEAAYVSGLFLRHRDREIKIFDDFSMRISGQAANPARIAACARLAFTEFQPYLQIAPR